MRITSTMLEDAETVESLKRVRAIIEKRKAVKDDGTLDKDMMMEQLDAIQRELQSAIVGGAATAITRCETQMLELMALRVDKTVDEVRALPMSQLKSLATRVYAEDVLTDFFF